MKQKLEAAARENILFNHRTVDRTLSGKYLAQFGEMNFIQGAEWHAKQSPWISVEDSFPEDNALVLCSSQIYGKVVLRWNKLAKEWLYPEENHIYCDWDKVDCWMYIPEV